MACHSGASAQRGSLSSSLCADGLGCALHGQRAVRAHDERARAGHFGVEPPRQRARVGAVGQAGQVLHQGRVGRGAWGVLAVPAVQGVHGGGQGVGDFGVFHRALQQRGNGHEQRDQQEHQQGQGQRKGAPFAARLGARQGLAQRTGGAAFGGNGVGMGQGGLHAGVLLSAFHKGIFKGAIQEAYWVAQAAKRFSSASPWSAQKPTLNCSASLALVAEVGRSSRTFLSSDASALLLAGP